jgi:hypothetical protein
VVPELVAQHSDRVCLSMFAGERSRTLERGRLTRGASADQASRDRRETGRGRGRTDPKKPRQA